MSSHSARPQFVSDLLPASDGLCLGSDVKRWNLLLKKIALGEIPSSHIEGRLFFYLDDYRVYYDDGFDFVALANVGDNPSVHSDAFHQPPLKRDIDLVFLADGSAVTWTNQPSVLTEFLGATQHRRKHHIKGGASRLIVNVVAAGTTGAIIGAQYSIDGINWIYLDDSSQPVVDIGSTGLKVSDWALLAADALGDVYLRIVGELGDGVADPAFGLIALQFR